MPHTPHSTDKKAQLRHYLLNQRANHPHRLRDDAAITTHLRTLLATLHSDSDRFLGTNKVSQITPKITSDTSPCETSVRTADSSRVAAYVPHGSEPGGDTLLAALMDYTSELYLPCAGPAGQMTWARHDGTQQLHTGRYGIPEPSSHPDPTFMLEGCALIIAPAVACSPTGQRLGRGGGYYDRALAPLHAASHRPVVSTLLYNNEVRDDVPTEPHDMPVDVIICPQGIIWTNH